jgi:putative transposase
MDGEGALWDNVFIERLWRSVKYEDVYLRDYEGQLGCRIEQSILDFYDGRRPYSRLDGMTPDQAFFTPLPLCLAAQLRQKLHLSTRCSDNRSHL